MRSKEIMEMSDGPSFEPLKKRSHVITPGFSLVDEIHTTLKHVQEAKQITNDNKKKIAMMAQQIIDSLKHEN